MTAQHLDTDTVFRVYCTSLVYTLLGKDKDTLKLLKGNHHMHTTLPGRHLLMGTPIEFYTRTYLSCP